MASVWPLSAQWRNRYQHIGQSHHVYVEETRLDLRPIGGPSFDTWYSGDHHFHLNYGGHVLLAPEALVAMLCGGDLCPSGPKLRRTAHKNREGCGGMPLPEIY